MIPRMDPRTQLKCDRGEWGYRYRLVRTGGGSGLFSVGPHRFAFHPSSCDSHRRAEMSPIGDKTCLVSESFGSSLVASLYPCHPAKLASVSGR